MWKLATVRPQNRFLFLIVCSLGLIRWVTTCALRTQSLLQPLGYNPSHLLTLSTSRFASPHSRLGSFVLLIHLFASSSSLSLDLSLLTDDPSRPPPSPSELLRKSLGVLKMPFEQGMLRLGEDEVLWWCWAVTERHIEDAGKKGGEGMEEEALFPLIEVRRVVPFSSLVRSHR